MTYDQPDNGLGKKDRNM